MMPEQKEQVICTFLYAAEYKSFTPCRLVFTTSRMLAVRVDWKKSSFVADMLSALTRMAFALLFFPFVGGKKHDPIMEEMWASTKGRNAGSTSVNYNDPESEAIAGMSPLSLRLHDITIVPYDAVKTLWIEEYPLTNDYTIKFSTGRIASKTFMIPAYAVDEFRTLIAKTALAQKAVP